MNEITSGKTEESKILRLALDNKQIAVAVLGQALLDEGGIGAQAITIYYTCKEETIQLWRIADSLGYANPLGRKKHRNHFHYGFSVTAAKRKELYDQIGPLPNSVKDRVFRHLASRQKGPSNRKKGETKNLILKSILTEPKTVLDLMLELNLGASATRRHLDNLKHEGLARIEGKNENAFQKSRRTGYLWKAT